MQIGCFFEDFVVFVSSMNGVFFERICRHFLRDRQFFIAFLASFFIAFSLNV